MNYSVEIANSVRVVFEMLVDRGFSKSDLTPLLQISENTVHPDVRFMIDLPDAKIGRSKANIAILFDTSAKFVSKDVSELLSKESKFNKEDNGDSIIYIFKAPLNTADIKKINLLEVPKKHKKEIFSLLELQFNKSKHFLVPKHELINNTEDIDRIVEQHCIKLKTQFPHILKNDPMCKYLNGMSGDLIKVYRVSPTSATTIVYRVVI
jgi:DNA-directed RNA polymerase subunit H